MALLLSEVQTILKEPRNKSKIARAEKHQKRLRFHTETHLEPMEIAQPLSEFLEWVKGLIPKDKFKIFVSLFKFPSPNVELIGKVYNELERVFDGRNSAVNFQFLDSTLKDDWEWFRNEILKEPDIWKSMGWAKMKTAINSVLIVDLPREQSGARPEPYFYWLDFRHVHDFKLKGKEFDWIVFKQDDNKYAAFDDEFLRVFEVTSDMEIQESTMTEIRHDLTYCPAKFFWTESLTEECPELKKAPISTQLGNLDWLLFFSISKRHLDLYAPYPIYSGYAADCTFRNNSTGDYCDGGYLRNNEGHYRMLNDGTVERCPICSDKNIAGVGSFVEIPVPTENSVDMRNPVQITTIDKDSLTYNVDEVIRLRDEIYKSIVGDGGEVQKKQGINELQVTANFDDKTTVLNGLKTNFELAQKFVDDTICRLRYGDMFINSTVNWGTEFYIYTVDELYNKYKQARDNGASDVQLDAIYDQIVAVEYKNNPVQQQRMYILKQLEPYRHKTIDELVTLLDKNLIDPDLLEIKINFTTFVDRFERENTNIIEFGSLLSFREKINSILNVLKSYGRPK